MLSQLLSLFFSKQDPQEAIHRRLNSEWADWLAPISAEKPVGDDLTYHDTFQEIKEEIAKLSGVDYALVMSGSETILKQHSKDIRVATYYCLARLHIDGATGFADGLELLAGLLDRFGTTLYPSRSHIRKNAIEWLANAKFTEVLTKLQPIEEVSLSRIIAALNLIDQCNKIIFSSEDPSQSAQQPDLDGLILFFSNSLKQPAKIKSSPSADNEPVVSDTHYDVTPMPASNDAAIRSQRDLLDQARRIAAFLREKPEGYLAAGRFLRALRWDTVSHLPPMDHRGRTRLPAPRTELRHNISRLILQQQWHELFERVEAAFMENANHFWFDLQRAAVLALQKMGEPYQSWAEIYLTDIGLVLERLQGIERLTFENGTPFADDETLHWIATVARIHHLDDDSALAPIAVSGENDWNEIEKQAIDLASNDGLEKAFIWLQSLPAIRLPKQSYLLQYTQARIAEQNGKLDLALKLLVGLDDKQDSMNLSDWEPALIFDVKHHLLRLLKQKLQLKDVNKAQLNDEIERLHHELIQLDPARALTVI
ncbi:type VI secretion system protein VasJ [Orbus hercynius]|uniref:Type VI secretion system protein VasJ n=1 Tax=Orbus hercynius TaxID=593135 RepID=A0A495RAF6_9GAMM|nr:type VI secretion system protein TssA [Orbus hercynius]RKS84473.1 type VI secretion system protein VasJ [Orbus hercynius]